LGEGEVEDSIEEVGDGERDENPDLVWGLYRGGGIGCCSSCCDGGRKVALLD